MSEFDIGCHRFSDSDLIINTTYSESILFNLPNYGPSVVELSRTDAIAIAKNFCVTAEEIEGFRV